jgi:hypothetical protein
MDGMYPTMQYTKYTKHSAAQHSTTPPRGLPALVDVWKTRHGRLSLVSSSSSSSSSTKL